MQLSHCTWPLLLPVPTDHFHWCSQTATSVLLSLVALWCNCEYCLFRLNFSIICHCISSDNMASPTWMLSHLRSYLPLHTLLVQWGWCPWGLWVVPNWTIHLSIPLAVPIWWWYALQSESHSWRMCTHHPFWSHDHLSCDLIDVYQKCMPFRINLWIQGCSYQICEIGMSCAIF